MGTSLPLFVALRVHVRAMSGIPASIHQAGRPLPGPVSGHALVEHLCLGEAAAAGRAGDLPVLPGAVHVAGGGAGEGFVTPPLYNEVMDVICVDCGQVIPGAAHQRRRCDACRKERFRSYAKPIRTLRDGEEPPAGEPRRFINGEGYIRLRWSLPGEYVEAYEHRVVAGAKDGEQVHHIDGNRTNNDPSNLCVLSPEEHHRLHAEHGSGPASTHKFIRIDGDEAERLYKLGYGTERIGRILSADPSAVWRLLKRRGVQIRRGYGGPKRKAG
ncbi:HNH endonuclease signature motif containing protein [Bifidobacterium boum]|uniref:HNH endonuclease signature motif containing protein n=1 Tax=Bacteria TaxID=2 RepID=UPI003F93F4C5